MQVRFTQAQLTNLFKTSSDTFFEKETAHILNGVAERSLCSRLAMYLEQLMPGFGIEGYYADTEYNRKQDGQIKTILDDQMEVVVINCDLIVHSRGNEAPDNLIAIEMKKSNRPASEKLSDRNRLRALTKKNDVWSYDGKVHPEHVSGYIIGVYMELDLKKRKCLFEKYKGGDLIEKWDKDF
jgi:hypothetical protein